MIFRPAVLALVASGPLLAGSPAQAQLSYPAPTGAGPINVLPPIQGSAATPYVGTAPPATTPPPLVLYRLLPGHWQREGAQSVWVPPETVPSPVQLRPLVPPLKVWNGERWVFQPERFAGSTGN